MPHVIRGCKALPATKNGFECHTCQKGILYNNPAPFISLSLSLSLSLSPDMPVTQVIYQVTRGNQCQPCQLPTVAAPLSSPILTHCHKNDHEATLTQDFCVGRVQRQNSQRMIREDSAGLEASGLEKLQ